MAISIQDDKAKKETDISFSQDAPSELTDHNPEKKDPHKCYKIGKTVAFIFGWICLGMLGSIDSPATPDLRDRLGANMEDLSLSLGFRSIGIPVGAIFAGMLADRYRNYADLVGGAGAMLNALASLAQPHMPNLILLGLMSFISGIGDGALNSVGQAAISWMWKEKAGPPMNSIHLGFPLGAAAAPLIAMNFLKPEEENNTMTTMEFSVTQPINQYQFEHQLNGQVFMEAMNTTATYFETTKNEEPISRIEIPYGIIGGIGGVFALLQVLLCIIGFSRSGEVYGYSKTSMREVWSAKGFRSRGDVKFTVSIIVLVCLFFSCRDTLNSFIFSYAVDSDLNFSNDEASLLDTVYKAVGVFGRLLCIVITIWAPIQPMFVVFTVLHTLFNTCLALLGPQTKVYLWVFVCLAEVTGAPIWPTAMLWTGRYIDFSSLIVGIIMLADQITKFIKRWLSGLLYDKYGPNGAFIFNMGLSQLQLLVMVILQIYGSCYPKRHGIIPKDEKSEKINVVNSDIDQFSSKVNLETEFTKM